MTKTLFLAILAILVGVLVTMIGNEANTAWQTANDGVTFVLSVAAFTAFAGLLGMTHDYYVGRYQVDTPVMMFISMACGAFLYGFIAGPMNHSTWGWASGWLIFVLAGLYPTLDEIYNAVEEWSEERHLRHSQGNVTPFRKRND